MDVSQGSELGTGGLMTSAKRRAARAGPQWPPAAVSAPQALLALGTRQLSDAWLGGLTSSLLTKPSEYPLPWLQHPWAIPQLLC